MYYLSLVAFLLPFLRSSLFLALSLTPPQFHCSAAEAVINHAEWGCLCGRFFFFSHLNRSVGGPGETACDPLPDSVPSDPPWIRTEPPFLCCKLCSVQADVCSRVRWEKRCFYRLGMQVKAVYSIRCDSEMNGQ